MNDEPTVMMLPDYTDANPYQRKLADHLEARGVDVTLERPLDGPLPVLGAVLLRGRPSVIHVHFLSQFLLAVEEELPGWAVAPVTVLLSVRFMIEVAVLRLLGVSIVWTVHDLLDHERIAPRVELVARSLFARVFADGIIVHCESATDIVRDAYRLPASACEKMTVVPHGNFDDAYPDAIAREDARESLSLPAGAFVYTFFGSIKRYKNVVHLIETFHDLADRNARLVIAGAPQTARLRTLVKACAAADDRVLTELERVPAAEVQTYMNAADVVALPFRTDPQTLLTSGSVMLAMGFGRPVIAPSIGCNPDMLGDGGILYGTDRTLRDAMIEARAADLDAMGTRNRDYVDDLSWDRVAARTRTVYDRAMEQAS